MPVLVEGRTREDRFKVELSIAEQIIDNPEIKTKDCAKAVREKLACEEDDYEWVTTKYVRVYAKWKHQNSRVQMYVRNLKLVTKEDHIEMLTKVQRHLVKDLVENPDQLKSIKPARKIDLLDRLTKAILTYTGQHVDIDPLIWETQKMLLRLLHGGAAARRQLEDIASYDEPVYIDADTDQGAAGSPQASSITEPSEIHAVAIRIPEPSTSG
jgi:hypothetical protein